MYNFLAHTDEIRNQMLKELNLNSLEELFCTVPQSVLSQGDLNLDEGISEMQARKKLAKLASKNKVNNVSFLGGGCYNRYIPSAVKTLASRTEFVSAYTPYQPEISQGSLQVMYEFQSMMCNLTGMDVANASVYDGATACAESILMAARIKRKDKVLVSSLVNPEYLEVIKTYAYGCDIEVEYLENQDGLSLSKNIYENNYACILIQNPNYIGNVEQVQNIYNLAQELSALFIVCADPLTLGVIEAPANYGADIVVGDIQPLGIPMNFGGPHAGFIACKTKHMRQLPGRIAGLTKDEDGKRAFTLTLQAREQHIRREKATSNICTNQALIALYATIYLSLLGPRGLEEVNLISMKNAKYLASKLAQIEGVEVLYNNFINEFVAKFDNKIYLRAILDKLEAKGYYSGIEIGKKIKGFDNCLLICATETHSKEEIDSFLSELESMLSNEVVL